MNALVALTHPRSVTPRAGSWPPVRPNPTTAESARVLISLELDSIYAVAQAGSVDQAIDTTFRLVTTLVRNDQILQLDELVNECDLERLPPAVGIALFMATYPIRDRLAHRSQCLARFRLSIQVRVPVDAPKILRHLR